MRTLLELAECYERWALDGEAMADGIVAGLNTLSEDLQVKQLESAEALREEARFLRQEAARLRETWSLPGLQLPPRRPRAVGY